VKTYPLFQDVEAGGNVQTRCFYDARFARKTGKSTGTGTGGGEPSGIGGPCGSAAGALIWGDLTIPSVKPGRKTIEVFEDGAATARTMALFPEDRTVEVDDEQVVRIRLKDVEVRRPRQWEDAGWRVSCTRSWVLDDFWAEKLEPSRKGPVGI